MASVFKKIWPLAACVCATFTVTIGTFPAVTADAKSTLASGGAGWDMYFVPVACFLLFNVSDWAGRSLTALCTWPGQDSRLLPVLVACRTALVPALMLCNVQPRRHLPVVFRHDAFFAAFMMVFAFSNGYLASLAMCFGPKSFLTRRRRRAPSWPSSCLWVWLRARRCPSSSELWFEKVPASFNAAWRHKDLLSFQDVVSDFSTSNHRKLTR
ncbi:equilibrative nucleoside transporter 1-like [Vanacampus margaritifer]